MNTSDPEYKEKNRVEGGTLYLVATPIGNLSDLSERGLKVLREVDFIAAEDTRNTLKLLTHFGISKPLISYHEHNKRERGEQIARKLKSGESCALVTDAGTPAISDPGEDLVALCAAYQIPVVSIPGCCAAITALTLSALPTRRFVFEGFLESDKKARRAQLNELAKERRTFILYEAPHRLCDTLEELYTALGERRIALCRELTKLNETVERMTLSGAVAHYKENSPRGEYVLVIEGASQVVSKNFWDNMTIPEHVEHYINEGRSRMDAIKQTAKDRGLAKSVVYNAMEEIKDREEE
ncbi:MAG: 16S rRNA (cytidine(1402)-2'-O)-methyltransferase [Clostridia bacterium]|nr:16S rRNA (cytidine(1402)-2'-O)-methyltransferase [Clostridia bacterium]